MESIAKKLVKVIKSNQSLTYVTVLPDLIASGDPELLSVCLEKIRSECPTTSVMLIGSNDDSVVIVCDLVEGSKHTTDEWLQSSIKDAPTTESPIFNGNPRRVCVLKFNPKSEISPFKYCDQVLGQSNSWLRKVGLFVEEEEEKEYGFDDCF